MPPSSTNHQRWFDSIRLSSTGTSDTKPVAAVIPTPWILAHAPAITHILETKPVTTVVRFVRPRYGMRPANRYPKSSTNMWRDTISYQQAQMSG
jgi:hypothetical protein